MKNSQMLTLAAIFFTTVILAIATAGCGGDSPSPINNGGGETKRTLTVGANPPSGGSVSINGAAATGATTHDAGAQVTAAAAPNAGYTFIGWSGASTSTNASVTVTVNSNLTLTANFQEQGAPPHEGGGPYSLTLNPSPQAGGTVTRNPDKASYAANDVVAISALPAEGYTFSGWTVTEGAASIASANSMTTTATLSASATVTAMFTQMPASTVTYSLIVTRNPASGGSVTPASQSNIAAGQAVNISADAYSGYVFVNWTVTSGTAEIANPNSAATTVTLSGNATVTANFQATPAYTLTVSPNSSRYGTVTPTSYSGEIAGVPINISATPASGYMFQRWAVSGAAEIADPNSAATTVTLSGSATIVYVVAYFKAMPTYALTVTTNNGHGRVTPTSQTEVAGAPINISAEAFNRYVFVNWTVTRGTATIADSSSAATTVTLASNATVTANFQVKPIEASSFIYGGQTYKTVKIAGTKANRWWMAENLNYETANSWCNNNETSNCEKYGRLYTLEAAMTACPSGWHLPSRAEWEELVSHAGGSTTAGKTLKSTSGWALSYGNGGNGTDELGFTALPGGNSPHIINGTPIGTYFRPVGSSGYWWSAMADKGDNYCRAMFSYYDDRSEHNGVVEYSSDKGDLHSVRCVQD